MFIGIQEAGDCTTDIMYDYQWEGSVLPGTQSGIENVQICMDLCDMNSKCVGWAYRTEGKWCWFYSKINGIRGDKGAMCGSCVGKYFIKSCIICFFLLVTLFDILLFYRN